MGWGYLLIKITKISLSFVCLFAPGVFLVAPSVPNLSIVILIHVPHTNVPCPHTNIPCPYPSSLLKSPILISQVRECIHPIMHIHIHNHHPPPSLRGRMYRCPHANVRAGGGGSVKTYRPSRFPESKIQNPETKIQNPKTRTKEKEKRQM